MLELDYNTPLTNDFVSCLFQILTTTKGRGGGGVCYFDFKKCYKTVCFLQYLPFADLEGGGGGGGVRGVGAPLQNSISFIYFIHTPGYIYIFRFF